MQLVSLGARIALLAAAPLSETPATQASEYGWLLEAPSVNGAPDYWTGSAWSPQAFDAVRFASKENGEKFLEVHHKPNEDVFMHLGSIFVREHGFLLSETAPSGTAKVGECPECGAAPDAYCTAPEFAANCPRKSHT